MSAEKKFFILCVWICVWERMNVLFMWRSEGDEMVWVLGIELRALRLMAGALPAEPSAGLNRPLLVKRKPLFSFPQS